MMPEIKLQKPLVLLPTFNERDNLIAVIDSVQIHLSAAHILVIDDNSPDGTGQIASDRASIDSKVSVLHRGKKEGLGKAYLAGFQWGLERNFTHFFEMDADLSHDPKDLPRLLDATENADIALGCRYIKGGSIRGWSPKRLILSRLGNLYARIILGVSYKDLTGGFKCFTRKALERIDLDQIQADGYGFQIETTWRAIRAHLNIIEIPILFTDRINGASKLSSNTVTEALLLVWKLRLFSWTKN